MILLYSSSIEDITKPQDASCLTLQITDDGGYKLSTHDCGETHPALCESITDGKFVCLFLVFNVPFNNIPVISWQSVLLVEITGVHGENHRPGTSHLQNFIT
jgi:hypothetical protein